MAHWQLGHRDEAQTWYDAVAQRMNDRAADDDTKRLRAEAEELLGIAATPSEPSEQHETPAEIPQ
jgi:hypothetical protein